MSNRLRSLIRKKVTKSLQNANNAQLDKVISTMHLRWNKADKIYSFLLPMKASGYSAAHNVQEMVEDNSNNVFDSITTEKDSILFNLSREVYVKEILEHNHSEVAPPFLGDTNQNLIIEFSSPNIAKPFHLGHLRSTIIGNYIANINSFLQNNVKKINYLGDWGTQFGFIQLGLDIANIKDEEMKSHPLQTLYTAYVAANKLSETDPSILNRAREIFTRLESGDDSVSQNWEMFKGFTVEELRKTYQRIGIVFDEYHWESMYNAEHIKHIINSMEHKQLLTNDELNRKIIHLDSEKIIPIIKSDGSTLYVMRDIAAAIDRFEKNQFDRMYYVVDNAQTEHFSNLFKILKKMEMPWADRLQHVKFGRIRGMSTRKGTAVFLEDILNEMRTTMREHQTNSKTTKVSLDLTDDSAEILGISGVIINDLKQRRQKDYVFDWNTMFDMKGDSGIKLQYVHCRLVNLEINCGATLPEECDPSLLKEPEVDELIKLIGQFDEVILKSYEQLEPCTLTVYLFQLSNAVNKAMKTLRIKGQPADLGSQRLLLFHAAKNVLSQGMKLLGLTPLNKM